MKKKEERENVQLEDIATCKEPCDDNSMSMWHLSHEGWIINENRVLWLLLFIKLITVEVMKIINRGDNIEEVTICDRLTHRNIEMFQQHLWFSWKWTFFVGKYDQYINSKSRFIRRSAHVALLQSWGENMQRLRRGQSPLGGRRVTIIYWLLLMINRQRCTCCSVAGFQEY